MSSVEYGRVSSQMAEIVNDELSQHNGAGSAFSDNDIVVQMGENYNYARLNEEYNSNATETEKIAALNDGYGHDLDQKILTPGGEIS